MLSEIDDAINSSNVDTAVRAERDAAEKQKMDAGASILRRANEIVGEAVPDVEASEFIDFDDNGDTQRTKVRATCSERRVSALDVPGASLQEVEMACVDLDCAVGV